jgi:hypothetical protein
MLLSGRIFEPLRKLKSEDIARLSHLAFLLKKGKNSKNKGII